MNASESAGPAGDGDASRADDVAPARSAASSPATRNRYVIAAVVVGLGLGFFSVIADGVVPFRALVILGNLISPWAIAAFAVGRYCSSWRRGAWAGTLTLIVGVATYYLGHAVRVAMVGDPGTDFALSAVPLIWLVAAVTIGPLLGAAGATGKRHELLTVAAVALPCVVLLAETGFLVIDRRPWLWDLVREPHRLTDLTILIGLVALAVAIPIRIVPDRRRRFQVYAVTVVAAAAGSIALVGLYRLLVHLA